MQPMKESCVGIFIVNFQSLYITQALHVNSMDVVTYKLKPPNYRREREKNPFS